MNSRTEKLIKEICDYYKVDKIEELSKEQWEEVSGDYDEGFIETVWGGKLNTQFIKKYEKYLNLESIAFYQKIPYYLLNKYFYNEEFNYVSYLIFGDYFNFRFIFDDMPSLSEFMLGCIENNGKLMLKAKHEEFVRLINIFNYEIFFSQAVHDITPYDFMELMIFSIHDKKINKISYLFDIYGENFVLNDLKQIKEYLDKYGFIEDAKLVEEKEKEFETLLFDEKKWEEYFKRLRKKFKMDNTELMWTMDTVAGNLNLYYRDNKKFLNESKAALSAGFYKVC